MDNNYQWHGEPVAVRFGYVKQKENTEKPLFWYNFECHNEKQLDDSYQTDRMCSGDGRKFALIPAIEVTQGTQTWVIANHYGIGVNKLLKGGWPNSTHFSLQGEFKEESAPYFKITEFDLEEFEYHEYHRRTWQKDNYPEEFERMERLRESMRNPLSVN